MNRFENIRQWAKEKDLLKQENSYKQLAKLMEESGELADSMLKGNKEEFRDAIGDCVVVLTILAKQNGFDIETCIETAWNEIKNRKGRTIGGNFIKE